MNHRLSLALRLAISIGLLALLFWRGGVDLPAVFGALRGASWPPLAGAFLLYCVIGTWLRGLRWRVLIDAQGHAISLRRSTELFLVGTFFNQLLPTSIGGDVVRTLMLGRDGLGRARAASTVIVDRAIGILGLLAIGAVALAAAQGHVSPAVRSVLIGAGVLGVAASLLLMRASAWRRWAVRLPVVGRLAANEGVARFVDSFGEYGASTLAVATVWSLGFTACLIGANALIGRALGIDQATLADWSILVPVASLSTLLPSIGGLGIREWTYVGLLALLQPPVSADTATAMSFLFWGMNLVLAAVGGVLAGWRGSVVVPALDDEATRDAAE